MATRNEKIFRSETIKLLNLILNDISELSERLKAPENNVKKSNRKFEIQTYSKIAHALDDFFTKNQITDEQIRKAVDGK